MSKFTVSFNDVVVYSKGSVDVSASMDAWEKKVSEAEDDFSSFLTDKQGKNAEIVAIINKAFDRHGSEGRLDSGFLIDKVCTEMGASAANWTKSQNEVKECLDANKGDKKSGALFGVSKGVGVCRWSTYVEPSKESK